MFDLELRDEFLGEYIPGTAISLRTSDNQGTAQKYYGYGKKQGHCLEI
jgi:hypothetical protein